MPLRAVYDIFLHLDMFKNIDLLKRGLYQVRINLYYEIPEIGTKIYAAPYFVGNLQKMNDIYNLEASNIPIIMEDEYTFCSRNFPIVYSSETSNLSEYAQFRIEVEMINNFQNIPLFITFYLYYREFESKAENNNKIGQKLSFVEIESSKFILYNLFQGCSNYIPAIFGEFFYSLLDCTIHSSLVQFIAKKNYIEINEENEVCKIVKTIAEPEVKKHPNRKMSKYQSIINQELLKNSKNLQTELNAIVKKFSIFINKLIKKYSSIINKKPEKNMTDPALYSLNDFENSAALHAFDQKEFNKVSLPKQSIKRLEHLLSNSNHKSKNKENQKENNLESSLAKLYMDYQALIKIIINNSHTITRYQSSKYSEFCGNRIKDYIFDDHYSKREERMQLAENFWKSKNYRFWGNINPTEIKLFDNLSDFPLIFEKSEIPKFYYFQDNSSNIQTIPQKKHKLFVFCHGFKGSLYDLNLLKNNLALLFFDSMFFLSAIDENECESDIHKMGEKMAKDLMKYLDDKGVNFPLLEINFFGHSLGGLVIRAALPFLEKFKDVMNSLVTFGTPHLGMKYHNSKLLSAGMWILKKFTNWNCIDQLRITDNPNYKECFLYKLSHSENLLWFKNIILVSSSQDSFVPYDSTRIEISSSTNLGYENDLEYLDMAQNLNNILKKIKVVRLDVNFKLQKK